SIAFLEFLKNEKFKNDAISQRMIQSVILSLLQKLLDISSKKLNDIQADNPEVPISSEKIIEIISEIIIESLNTDNDIILLENLDKETFHSDFSEYCKGILRENVYLADEYLQKITDIFIELSYQIVVSKNSFDSISGIVIGGYGSEELFPSLVSYEISYAFRDEIKIEKTNSNNVDLLNSDASIVPFAQSDMISTILTGMDPFMNEVVSQSIIGLDNLSEDEKYNIINQISEQQKQQFINPILGVVRTLALPELANMAETLVNLTSFKRHITDSLETVGGPVDVLVISKGDGPIWINRKEYFDISKNLEYSNRKRR
ncbi:TPA: hypothetical protein TU173_001160, partial [Streptococcus equi subsp. zooepidemicus]|nr:hypothetical protein [Streptococcus equi subsp. zooepidemicus]